MRLYIFRPCSAHPPPITLSILLHLHELLEQPVHLLDRRAAAARDALAAAAVDRVVAPALERRHRVDDGLDPQQLPLVDALGRRLLEVAHARQHPQDRLQRPHLADGPQLLAEVVEGEVVLPDLLLERRRLLLVERPARPSRSATARRPCPACARPRGRHGTARGRRGVSPLPTNAIGTPTTDTTDSAAPPRASPSIFVRTTPVTPTRRLNSPALLMASCPVIASAT